MYHPVVLLLLGVSAVSLGGQMGPKTPRPSDFAQCRLSADLREQFVDIHNEVRGQVQPTAADMEYLELSDDLGNLAQMWSDKCEWKHGFTAFGDWHPNKEYRSKSVGQNLAREWGKWLENDPGPEDSVRRWFKERQYYKFAKFAYPMPTWMCRKEPCGHYTQVVWAKSKKVGCALNWCDKYFDMPHPWVPGETVVTCDYYPSGNVVGQLPYTTGPSCSKCASGQGWCYKNLCRECKDFSPRCGTTGYTKDKCLTETDHMEKYCPHMCNLCRCPLQCKNGGQVDRKTCTCTCYGKWKGADCSEKICDPGWYGENCEKRCVDRVGSSTCKWRVRNGHSCAVAYMKIDCVKTCVCDLLPKPKPRPQPPPATPTKATRIPPTHPTLKTSQPPSQRECKDTCESHCKFWAGLGECKNHQDWMRKNCMKSCQVCACQDGFDTDSCQKWAAKEECKKNPLWMEVNCPRSCLVCDCHDKDTHCGKWAESGECDKNKVWMQMNCKKSCKKC